VVRDIFKMKLDGASAARIADELNRMGVLSPIMYKKDRGLPHPKGGYGDKEGAKSSRYRCGAMCPPVPPAPSITILTGAVLSNFTASHRPFAKRLKTQTTRMQPCQ
jgi:hypothetical protein